MYRISLMYKNVFNLPLHKNCSASCVHVLTCLIFSNMKEGPFDIQGGGTLPTADSWYRKPSPRLCPGLYWSWYIGAQSANETKHSVSPQLIGQQLHCMTRRQIKDGSIIITNMKALCWLVYFRKPSQRGGQGYLSSLQRRVGGGVLGVF